MAQGVFIRVNGYVLCPKCKIPMYYGSETVKDSSGVKITRFYQCPACRLKLVDERIEVVREDSGSVEVIVRLDRRTLITARIERPHRRRNFNVAR